MYLKSASAGKQGILYANTHTQLIASGKFSKYLLSAFNLLIVAALLSSSLFLTSCSLTDSPVGTTTASSETTNNSNTGKSNHGIDAWSDAGVFHNNVMRDVNDSMALNWPNRFTNLAGYMDWLNDDLLGDIMVNTYGMSSYNDGIAATAFNGTDEEDRIFTNGEYSALLADLVLEEDISQRESDFMARGRSIHNMMYAPLPNFATIQDSLDDWKNDIIAITWTIDEVTIVNHMSVRYYAIDFWLDEGFDFTDEELVGPVMLHDFDPNPAQVDVDAYDYARDVLHLQHEQALNYSTRASANYGSWYLGDRWFN